MKRFLLVGRSYSKLRQAIEEAGHEWLLLRHSKTDVGPDPQNQQVYYGDLMSEASITRALSHIHEEIDGVMTIYEQFVVAKAQIASILGLPSISVESARACSNKFEMRKRFKAYDPAITPAYAKAETWDAVKSFSEHHDFPIILKPTNLSKSLMVTKNESLEELRSNYDAVIASADEVYEKYAAGKKPEFITEEYMEGKIYSVDGFADHEGKIHILDAVVDYTSGYEIGMKDNFHYSRVLPSKLSEEDRQSVRETAKKGMLALGMRSSPAHCEIIMTDTGPKLVEIGARNGGYRDLMHKLANGIDIYALTMKIALGETIDVTKQFDKNCAVLELFPDKRGRFKELSNLEKLENLPSTFDVRIMQKPGTQVGLSSQGYKMSARIVLFNESSDDFKHDLQFIKNNVKIIIE